VLHSHVITAYNYLQAILCSNLKSAVQSMRYALCGLIASLALDPTEKRRVVVFADCIERVLSGGLMYSNFRPDFWS